MEVDNEDHTSRADAACGQGIAQGSRLGLREQPPVAVDVDAIGIAAPVALDEAVGIEQRRHKHVHSLPKRECQWCVCGERLDESLQRAGAGVLGRVLAPKHQHHRLRLACAKLEKLKRPALHGRAERLWLGLDLRRPLVSTPPLEAVHAAIRARVPAMMTDRPLSPDIVAVRALIDDGSLLAAAAAAGVAM